MADASIERAIGRGRIGGRIPAVHPVAGHQYVGNVGPNGEITGFYLDAKDVLHGFLALPE